ncbi:MAG: hypothetical protein HWN67_14355 [Candidatus Helarchaeota archaeon]|nr:hypothetical protein [Candidatus Helarchaeota archaeon]
MEWITYLLMIPKTFAEDCGNLFKILNPKVSIDKNLDKNIKFLFHIQLENLNKVEFCPNICFYQSDDEKFIDERAYIFTDRIYPEHKRIIFDNYFMIKEIMRKKSVFISPEAWEDYRFWELKIILNKLNKLKEEKEKIKSGKYYLIFNTIESELWGYYELVEGKTRSYYSQYPEENIHYNSCKEILINPKILLPEIYVLYLGGRYDTGEPLWEKPFLGEKPFFIPGRADDEIPKNKYGEWDWYFI